MKLLIASLLSATAIAAPAETCFEQQNCLAFKIDEITDPAKTCSGGCEYRVCWRQVLPEEDDSCVKDGSFSHIGDQFQGDVGDPKNCPNANGWDDTCLNDPGVLNDWLCQNVPAGGVARFLVKDGGSCAATPVVEDEVQLSPESGSVTDVKATCYPSTSEGQPDATGPTFITDAARRRERFLRMLNGKGNNKQAGGGGTCSGNSEGQECVWTVPVPDTCGGPAPTVTPQKEIVSIPTAAPVAPTDAPVAPTDAPVTIPQPENAPVPTVAPVPAPTPGSKGDPHFKTWVGEHFEYHGQCDMVLAKDPNFADGLGLNVQIRTKLVRYWSYIKSAAIRIGDDIFELEGSAHDDKERNYWMNLEYQGKLSTIGGFPITANCGANYKCWYDIDLSSKYPGQIIRISFFKEFISIDFKNPSVEAFGNVVGILGNFKTGKTLARDGVTELHDFTKLGNEWQVLPVENDLFHGMSDPQFPKRCIEPEDPQGQRRRRLGEKSVTTEQAEEACSKVKDPTDRKFCVYDILATQDMDMVGAY